MHLVFSFLVQGKSTKEWMSQLNQLIIRWHVIFVYYSSFSFYIFGKGCFYYMHLVHSFSFLIQGKSTKEYVDVSKSAKNQVACFFWIHII